MFKQVSCFVLPILCVHAQVHAQHQDLLYVLQPDQVTVQELADADVDWLILEPTVDGDLASSFTALEIEQIRSGGACPKKVLAYLSVGEAESYRDYFDASWLDGNDNPIPGVAPAWLGPTNPDWEGNYKVRYWMPEWQHIIVGTDAGPHDSPYDKIIDQGFDGVYLDIIDAFYFWSSAEDGIVERSRAQARTEMIGFVEEIAHHARVIRGDADFMVFPQGGADIILNDNDELDAETAEYFVAISGIGQEDVWYDELAAQGAAETAYTLDQLRAYKANGEVVLITDYVINRGNPSATTNNARVSDFLAHVEAEGFIGYGAFNDRALDAIVAFGGSGWSVNQPEPGCAAVCAADLSGDGVLNFFDISAFLGAFNMQESAADFTGDWLFNFFDISAFLVAFNAGCP